MPGGGADGAARAETAPGDVDVGAGGGRVGDVQARVAGEDGVDGLVQDVVASVRVPQPPWYGIRFADDNQRPGRQRRFGADAENPLAGGFFTLTPVGSDLLDYTGSAAVRSVPPPGFRTDGTCGGRVAVVYLGAREPAPDELPTRIGDLLTPGRVSIENDRRVISAVAERPPETARC